MRLSSLGFRLFLLSFLSILLALVATTFVLNARFHAYFVDRIYGELQQQLEQLTTNLSLDETGALNVAPLLDRRFDQPFSGLYWQVEEVGGPVLVSRSLWGGKFEVPQTLTPGIQFRAQSRSPIGKGLLVAGWPVLLGEADQQRTVVLSVAIDDTEVTEAASGFRRFLVGWLAIMFAGLLVAAWAQVRIGLAPLKLIRQRIGNVRAGSDTRLDGEFPSEVKPLVDEVNELLELHETSLASARTRASDLAHGLKTPLTVMRALAVDLAGDGQAKRSDEIEAQITRMHQFIERELARVNVSLLADALFPVGPVITRMVASIKKLPGGDKLNWTVEIPDDLSTPFDGHTLSELIGNLLDNARKWARATVVVRAGSAGDGSGWIRVMDDGPGIPADQVSAVLERGSRLDAKMSGTGLGLTIAADLVAQNGGELSLSQADIGGLEVAVTW